MLTKVTSAPTQVFDYIICEGGTAGCHCISPSRRSKHNCSLEAGKHNDLLENTKMTGGWTQLADTTEDWNLVTVPQTDANDRLVKLTRGRFLGRSSSMNGTLCVRGVKQDFDDWGMKGWSGEEFWPYMLQAETFHPKDWFKHDPTSHETSGPLHTEPHDAAPITNLLLNPMDFQGLPYDPDMFAHGNTPHGCGHSVRTVHQGIGIRSTAADFISTSGNNLWVWTETIIDKINLMKSNDGELQATSVDAVHKDGVRSTVQAKKETIVSGGAYCSPPILLRSGIDAKTEVKNFGIKSKVDLPGVGQNLIDHVIVFLFYELTKPELINDHLIYCVDGSKYPLDNPVADPKYLNDPLDTLVLTEACRLANEIVMKGEGRKDIVQGAWPPSYHAVGSCKMGPADDPMAVVDERLRVCGLKGLRVADASIMPILHSRHTQLPVHGIAEKCVNMLIEDD
ncbi:GMC oxidoreductase [Sphaerobolus stellatus SS14]|nr:GMC oxidoreductase [Sphaerobolus stellatus SS14]